MVIKDMLVYLPILRFLRKH